MKLSQNFQTVTQENVQRVKHMRFFELMLTYI